MTTYNCNFRGNDEEKIMSLSNQYLRDEIERLNNIINEIEKEVTTLTLGSMYVGDTKVEKVLWHLGKKIEGLKNNLKEK